VTGLPPKCPRETLTTTMPAMGSDPTGSREPLKLPFGFKRRASPSEGGRFLLERRRKGTETWASEGWFATRSEAKRVARRRAHEDLGVEFRIRTAPEGDGT